MPLETDLQPRGVIPQGLKYLYPEIKVKNNHQQVKWATLFRANPDILIMQVRCLFLNNLHYIVSDLWKAAKPAQIKEQIKILV